MRTLAVVAVLMALVGCSGDSEESKGPDILGVRAGIAEAEGNGFCLTICRTVGGPVVSTTSGATLGQESIDFCPGQIRPCQAIHNN
jgi:hypothetical protein